MLSPEQNLTEKSLKANFTEVQQTHFDKLMAELAQISGGLGFSELKEKAEAGDKEALQVMRDYITKKEEIVEFIEKKEVPEVSFIETDIEAGSEVITWTPGAKIHGKRFEVLDVSEDQVEVKTKSGGAWLDKKYFLGLQGTTWKSKDDKSWRYEIAARKIAGFEKNKAYEIH